MQITDRSKDVIKSGGEWISSIELENLAVGHPKVAEAAVIGVRHPKWDERPLLVIVLKDGRDGDQGRTARLSSTARSPNGGCPTTWCSSPKSRTPPPARSTRPRCATQFKDYVLPTAALWPPKAVCNLPLNPEKWLFLAEKFVRRAHRSAVLQCTKRRAFADLPELSGRGPPRKITRLRRHLTQ